MVSDAGTNFIGVGIPSPAMMLCNRPIRSLLLQVCRAPINVNNDAAHYEALKAYQYCAMLYQMQDCSMNYK